jgi:hypothetical protein
LQKLIADVGNEVGDKQDEESVKKFEDKWEHVFE